MRYSSPLGTVALAASLLLTFPPRLSAQILYWAGTAGTVATAGSGTWDSNTSTTWRDNSPTGTLVKWTQNRTAMFAGSAGGSIAIGDVITADALQIQSTAGPFTLNASSLLTIGGAGISNQSTALQTLNNNLGILTFTGNASAASGSQASRVRIVNNGQLIFEGTSTAGGSGLTNASDLLFSENSSAGSASITSTGQVSFAGQSNVATATIINNSLLTFDEDASSGAATITNHAQLNFSGNARNFAAASIINNAGSALDLSASTATAGVTLGSLSNAADATLNLGTSRLIVASMSLLDGNAISFNLSPSGTGLIEITGSLFGNATASGTSISINDAGGLSVGRTVTLLDWTSAATVIDVQQSDFSLQPLPGGAQGSLRVQGKTLFLDVVPEPGTALLALFGALPLAVLRRRR